MGMKKVTVLPKHDSLSALLERFTELFVQKIVTIRQKMDQEVLTLSPYVPVGETVRSVTVPDLSNFTPATMEEVEKLKQAVPCKIMWAGPSTNLAAEATRRMPGSYYYQHCEHVFDR